MSRELDAKLKTALDESRLLILGAQVLFGFAFQAAFQDLFSEIGSLGRLFQIFAICLLCLSVTFLVVPSFYHQIACKGCSLHRAVHVATSFANWSLAPAYARPWSFRLCHHCALRRSGGGLRFWRSAQVGRYVNLPNLSRLRDIPPSKQK